jgi:ribose transport system permease protein
MEPSTPQTDPPAGAATPAAAPAARASRHARRGVSAPPLMLLLLTIVLIAVFCVLRPDTFATAQNARTILVENAVLAVLALAAMIPLVCDEFDLSPAATMGLASVLAAGLPGDQGIPFIPMTVLVLVSGVAIGAINGALVVVAKLPSIIVTLGSSTVVAGLILLYTNGEVIFKGVPQPLLDLGQAKLLTIGLPTVIMLAIGVALWFLFDKRPWGRRMYAVGSSAEASRLAGVNVDRVRFSAFVLAGLLSAIAGYLLTARVGSGSPTASANFLLPAFAAAFLSTAAFRIGFFNIWGVVLSVYFLAVGVTGLKFLGADFWVDPVFNGTALIVAVALSRLPARRRRADATRGVTA